MTDAIEVQQQVVELTEQTYPGKREQANDVRLRSQAHRTLGLLLLNSGETTLAGKAFNRSLAVLTEHDAEETDDPALLREFACTLRNTAAIQLEWMESIGGAGLVQMRQGNLPAARDYFQRLETAAREASESNPNNLLFPGFLPYAYERIAFVEMMSGNTEVGYEKFKAGLKISRQISQLDPLNAERQQDLVISLNQMCDISDRRGRSQEAIAYGEEAVELASRLNALDENDSRISRRVWVSNFQPGSAYKSSGDAASAEKWLTAAFELASQRMKKDPSDVQAQRDLATSGFTLGTQLYLQSEFSRALEVLEQARAMANKTTLLENPDSADHSLLFTILGRLASVHSDEGRLDEAIALHRQSVDVGQAIVLDSPKNMIAQRNMGVGLYKLAATLMVAKRYAEALSKMERAQQIAQSLVDSGQLAEAASSDLQMINNGLQEIRRLLDEQKPEDETADDN